MEGSRSSTQGVESSSGTEENLKRKRLSLQIMINIHASFTAPKVRIKLKFILSIIKMHVRDLIVNDLSMCVSFFRSQLQCCKCLIYTVHPQFLNNSISIISLAKILEILAHKMGVNMNVSVTSESLN